MKIRELIFTKSDFEAHQGPVVYELWQGEECTYVGYSANGFNRIFTKTHGGTRAEEFKIADRIVVSFYESKREAFCMETQLIHQRHPRGNAVCHLCGAGDARRKFDGVTGVWKYKIIAEVV